VQVELKTISDPSEYECIIDGVSMLNDTIRKVTLVLPEKIKYEAGQYLEWIQEDGYKVPYSIATAPILGNTIDMHIREPKDNYKKNMHNKNLIKGNAIRINMPKGKCYLNYKENCQSYIFLAEGTGFSQTKAIVEQCLSWKIKKPIRIYWKVKNERELYLKQLIETWVKDCVNLTYVPIISAVENKKPKDFVGGDVSKIIIEDYKSLEDIYVVASGSKGFVHENLIDLINFAKLNVENIKSDVFDYVPLPL